jgi:hypothetical protein
MASASGAVSLSYCPACNFTIAASKSGYLTMLALGPNAVSVMGRYLMIPERGGERRGERGGEERGEETEKQSQRV